MNYYNELKKVMKKVRKEINKKFPKLKKADRKKTYKIVPKEKGYLGWFYIMGDSTILCMDLGRPTSFSIHYMGERNDFLAVEQEGVLFSEKVLLRYAEGAISAIKDMKIDERYDD